MFLIVVVLLFLLSIGLHFLFWVGVMFGNAPRRRRSLVELIGATLPAIIAVGIIAWKLLTK